MSKRKRCAAKVEVGDLLGVSGTGNIFKVPCRKLAAPGRKICRTHLALKKKGQRSVRSGDAQERMRRRRERRRREKEARADAHVLIRQRQKAARRQKAKEPGTKPGSQDSFHPQTKKGKRYDNYDTHHAHRRQGF